MDLVDLSALDSKAVARGLRDFYQNAYSTPSYTYSETDMDEFEKRLSNHSSNAGFHCIGIQIDDLVVGFAYGFTFPDDRWWRGNLDGPPVEVKGKSLFGLIELAVSEDHRRKGYARTMHDALLRPRKEDYATLLSERDSVAHSIYPRWGWKVVGQVRSYPEWPVDDVYLLSLPVETTGYDHEIRQLDHLPNFTRK